MDILTVLDILNQFVLSVIAWVVSAFNWLVGVLTIIINGINIFLVYLGNILASVGRALARVAKGIANFRFSHLWAQIQDWKNRFDKWVAWYRKHILDPLDQMHRNLTHLYDQFFRPLINFIDDIRRFTQIVALFNRKLAAQIDRALFSLEARIMAPLLSVLRRVNQVASIQSAFLTRLGLFDRAVLLTSIQRDWKLAWRALLNGGQALGTRTVPPVGLATQNLVADWRQFVDGGTGPMAEQQDELEKTWQFLLVNIQ